MAISIISKKEVLQLIPVVRLIPYCFNCLTKKWFQLVGFGKVAADKFGRLKGAITRFWYFAGCFLCLRKFMLPLWNSIWQFTLKTLRKRKFNEIEGTTTYTSFMRNRCIVVKYFTLFLRRNRSINPDVFCKRGVPEIFCKLHRETPVLESLFKWSYKL